VHLRSKWARSICVSTKNKDVLLSHLCPDGYQRTLTIGRNLTVTKREKATLASHLAFRRRERAALWRAGAFCRNPERSEGISKRKKADHISMIGLYFMPATTYSPTHFRVQYNRPCGA